MTVVTWFYCRSCDKELTLVSELLSIPKRECPFCHQETLNRLPEKEWKIKYNRGINL